MADIIPPAPVDAPFGSYNWQDWYFKVRNAINNGANIAWNQITNFTGSNLTNLQTRNHNDLQTIQGGTVNQYYHLTQAQYTALTSGTYTPSASAVANCGILGNNVHQWSRIGNIVTVSGKTDLNAVAASGVSTQFEIDLPVASNLGTSLDVNGVCAAAGITEAGGVLGNAANDKARIQFLATSTSNVSIWYTFQYVVI